MSLSKPYDIVLLITALILTFPLIAMSFTKEVNWTIADFFVAAILLSGFGFAGLYIRRLIKKQSLRILVYAALIMLFVLIWGELAVGIFGTPFAGS